MGRVVAVAAGWYHNLALMQDGTVVAWGAGRTNNPSDGIDFGQSIVPSGLNGVIAIAAGVFHSLALKQDGTVVAWGAGLTYAFDDKDMVQSIVPSGLSGVIGIAAGWTHSLALVAVPAIGSPPQTQTAESGSTVRLSVSADGFRPLNYQWFFDGTNALAGATNALLELTNLQSFQAGAYTVVVTNLAGAVTSAPALLSVIPPVERRVVPAVHLPGGTGSLLHLEYADSLVAAAPPWTSFTNVTLGSGPQLCFDLSQPLPAQRFYRAWQTNGQQPALDLSLATEFPLPGAIGHSVRVDYINQFGPTDAWVTLDTVLLTNTTQLYFDVTAFRQANRLYRLVPVP
jgi:hypothetical protein